MLKEKERLREEWKTLEEQRKIFERERRNFTEAAIRLSHEVIHEHFSENSNENTANCVPRCLIYICELGKVRPFFEMTYIWLNLQRKAFEEDRATWLKHQFLNLSPFADSKKPPMSKSKSAFLICESAPLHCTSPDHLLDIRISQIYCWIWIKFLINKLNDDATYIIGIINHLINMMISLSVILQLL